MAPVKISYVVSFSSQDPKYPVENLLCEDTLRPWLGCPRDPSRQLRVELQLERASPIGYMDVGNCGSAFLQVEVGRSSWPPGRPYLTLLPCVALMTPADSKLERNRHGVRMFKEDFPVAVAGQQWDRLRLTCSQPFSRHIQFGLSFLRVRTPLDAPQHHPQHPPSPQQGPEGVEPTEGPWCSSPAFSRTFFPEPHSSSQEEQLKSRLQQLEPGARSPSRLSRPAQMVLLAARSRALRPRMGTATLGGDSEQPDQDSGGPTVPGPTHDVSTAPLRSCRRPDSRQRAASAAGRSLAATQRTSRSGGRARAQSHRERRAGSSDRGGDSGQGQMGICPICSGLFSQDLLPAHAAGCGEEDPEDGPGPSSLSWVSCPICGLPFSAAEVERHASSCGELVGTPGTPPPRPGG